MSDRIPLLDWNIARHCFIAHNKQVVLSYGEDTFNNSLLMAQCKHIYIQWTCAFDQQPLTDHSFLLFTVQWLSYKCVCETFPDSLWQGGVFPGSCCSSYREWKLFTPLKPVWQIILLGLSFSFDFAHSMHIQLLGIPFRDYVVKILMLTKEFDNKDAEDGIESQILASLFEK